MDVLLSFLIIISAGLILSEVFKKFHLPYVVALILAGIIIGPYGLGVIEGNGTLEFLGSIGLIFLMFMAGLDVRVSDLSRLRKQVSIFGIFNGAMPFVVGFAIAIYFGYGLMTAVLLGIIFISSSVAVVIPFLESIGLAQSRLGDTIIAATVAEDGLSLILLSIVLQTVNPTTGLPLPLFYLLFFFALLVLRYAIPRLEEALFPKKKRRGDFFEAELRFIFVVLLATVVFFDLIGIHPIVAGFFIGLILSETIRSKVMRDKLHALSYGLFIPVFFIIIGIETDVGVFFTVANSVLLASAIVVGSVVSKLISGYVGGRLCGFNPYESKFMAASTVPQLSTTLAVAFVGFEFELLDHSMITALVVLSIVTTFLGPMLMSRTMDKRRFTFEDRTG